MTTISQRSFSGGELAPALYARVDVAKYGTGLRTLRNMFVRKHGGVSNRPGSQFIAEVKDSSRTVRLIPFVFNNEQTYVLEFGHQYMRVHRAGAQTVEASQAITGITQADPAVVTVAGHGFANGDEIAVASIVGMTELNGRNLKVNGVTTNTFTLQYMDGTDVDSTAFTAYSSGGTVARVYEIVTPYIEEHLQDIKFVQSADVVTLVHQSYPPHEIRRLAHDSWTIEEISLAPGIDAPENLAVSGTGGTVDFWVVTALKEETFEESLASLPVGANSEATSGSPRTLTWTATEGAIQYNVYKRKNGVYGFIGNAGALASPSFVDNGITPDTTEVPPVTSSFVQQIEPVYEKLADPSDLPAGAGKGVAWSPDGNFVAVVHATTPYVTVWRRVGETFTKLDDPSTLPTGQGNGVAWSADSQYLAVAHATSPYVSIYQLVGNTLTKMADPATLPTGTGNGVAWDENSNSPGLIYSEYLVVAHDTTPFITAYRFSGGVFTKRTDPVTLPTGNAKGVAFGGVGFSVAHTNSPYVSNYGFVFPGAVITKVPNPSLLPTGNGTGVSYSSDGNFLAVSHVTSPYVTVYYVDSPSATYTKIPNPSDLPAGDGRGVGWSPDDQVLSVAHDTTPYVTIYKKTGTELTKLADPADLPAGNATGAAWSPTDGLTAVSHAGSPYVTIYFRQFDSPGAVTYYQQRLVFANTPSQPENTWASRSAAYKNFTISSPIQDDDAIIFSIASRQVNRIIHLVEMTRLLMFTSGGEWSIEGDGGGILRPGQINPKKHSENGVSRLAPIVSGGTCLYVQERGSIVRDFAFDFSVDGYRGNDLTIFSGHLFENYTLRDWAFQTNPNSIIWCVRDDGTLLGVTYLREQEMLAWHRHDTDGQFEQICAVPEGLEDAVYVVVAREIDGQTRRYVERMHTRAVNDIVDAAFMDCALSYDGRNTDTLLTMTISGGTLWTYNETLTLTCAFGFFVAGDVGNAIHLQSEDGDIIRFTITGYTSTTVVTGTAHKTVPVNMRSTALATWTKAVDELGGLWHLEGKEVAVFADGFVVGSPNNSSYTVLTVTDGMITLERPYGVIHVGLPITSDIETLDIDTVQGETMIERKKSIGTVNMIVESSRGIWAGPKPPTGDDALEGLFEYKARDAEGLDEPVSLTTGPIEVKINPEWNSNGRVFVRQVDPVPLSVLAIMPAGFIPFRG